MKDEKICLINESKYSKYHNPGNTASKVLLKNFNKTTKVEHTSDNFVEFVKKQGFTNVIFLNVPTLKPSILRFQKYKNLQM